MNIRLRVRESLKKSFDWEHAGPKFSAGRSDTCQLVFRGDIGEIVSAKHLEVDLSAAGAMVKDLDSTNGTYLNGARLTAPAPLRVGDHLQIGLAGPRLEVLSLDFDGAPASSSAVGAPKTNARATSIPLPWLVGAGAGIVTVACLLVLVLVMGRSKKEGNGQPKPPDTVSGGSAQASGTQTTSPPAAELTNQTPAVTATGVASLEGSSVSSSPDNRTTDNSAANDNINRPPANDDLRDGTSKPPSPAIPADGAIGQLVSEQDVLLREVDDQWQRAPKQSAVYIGERLIALPTYRPSIALNNGVTMQLLGGTMVSLGVAEEDGAALVQLASGRLLLRSSRPKSRIHIGLGEHRGILEIGSGKTEVAIEARRLFPDGADPEQQAASTAADLFVSSGQATWIDEDGQSEKLSGRTRRSIGRQAVNQSAGEWPSWLATNELTPKERRAASEIESLLKPDEPVTRAFRKLIVDRQVEKSLFAVQCLALLDDFEPLVPLLNDADYRHLWTPEVDSLRTAMARSLQSAKSLRLAFASARGRELGGQLYRLLWGFTGPQLEDGAANELINWLDAPDDQLDFRVLSFWNLHHITGLGLFYQPADPPQQRRASIHRWIQKQEAGLIVPQEG